MQKEHFIVTAKIWVYPSAVAQWHFITIPKKESQVITETYTAFKKGWGSLPVQATLNETTWNTSIFPDRKTGTYLLPLKALIRRKEDLEAGDTVTVHLNVINT
jgi:hypothetical protein